MNKTYLAGGIITAALLVTFVTLRANEDSWICTNGLWEKHGNPGAPMPNSECGDNIPLPPNQRFSNGQPYKTFVVNEFSIHYPDWGNMPPPSVSPTDVVPIALSNDGCAFMIRVSLIPEGKTFETFIADDFTQQKEKTSIQILKEDIGDAKSHFEAEITASASTLKNTSDTFLLKGNHTVGITFAGEKSKFEKNCAPLLSEVLASAQFK
jgi:ribosomal protein S24E